MIYRCPICGREFIEDIEFCPECNEYIQEIEDTVVQWHKLGKVAQIGTNAFASRYTIEQLLSMSNLKPLSDAEFKERIDFVIGKCN